MRYYFYVQKPKCASWAHIVKLHEIDSLASQRLASKLTKEHLHPTKEKMTVSTATQVFSSSVGNAILSYRKHKPTALSDNSCDTAQISFFFDDLFDSINGGGDPRNGTLKGSINEKSIPFEYWNYALGELENTNFVNVLDGKINNCSTVLKKFQLTIRGYIAITKICFEANMKQVAICLFCTNANAN